MIKVVHSSKYIDYIFNFTATENNLSWSLTAEGDGELFLNPLTNGLSTNVASFTINGATPTFPISLSNGSSKSVTIVKTTNGQTASLTLRQRRATNKAVDYSVPDFGLYNGRYKYVLNSNNTVDKYDNSLLQSSNYSGGGIWIVNPFVATITLPTPPTNIIWSHIGFVFVGTEERIIVCGGANANNLPSNPIFCYILSDNTVWNISKSVQNNYTQLTTSPYNNQNGRPTTSVFNYINGYLYVVMSGGNNGNIALFLNLNTNAFGYYAYSTSAQVALSFSSFRNVHIDPVNSRILAPYTSVESHSSNPRSYYYLGLGNGLSSKYLLYDKVSGYYIYGAHPDLGRFLKITNVGQLVSSHGATVKSQAYPRGYLMIHGGARTLFFAPNQYNSVSYNYVCFHNLVTDIQFFTLVTDLGVGHTFFYGCDASLAYGLFFAVSNSTVSRLHIFEPNHANGTSLQRYFDLPSVPVDFTNNQINS